MQYKRITGEQEDMEGAALRVFSANLRNSKVHVLLVDYCTPAGISLPKPPTQPYSLNPKP